MITITNSLAIPSREFRFVFGTSSGPGGQHANKVETKATLLFHINSSKTLTPTQKNSICQKLATRINKEGFLRVASSRHRSQKANRDAAKNRFATLIADAIAKKTIRKKTKVSSRQKRKRLEDKKKRGEVKRLRSKVKSQ